MNYRHSIAAMPAKGWYANFLRVLRTADQSAVTRDPLDSFGRSRTAAEIRRDARAALDRRINARGDQEWRNAPVDIDLIRDARDLDDLLTRRVRVYQFRTPLMRARFGHHLSSRFD